MAEVGAGWTGLRSYRSEEQRAGAMHGPHQWLTVLRRLASGWERPSPPPGLRLSRADSADARNLVPYDWASAWTRKAGSVAHRWLQEIAVNGVEYYTPDGLETLRPRIRQLLLRAGAEAVAVERAIERVLTCSGPRWTTSRGAGSSIGSQERVNECAVTVADGTRFRRMVIDRAFVAADGVRWIIDYRLAVMREVTGTRSSGRRSSATGPRCRLSPGICWLRTAPRRTALYFPLLAGCSLRPGRYPGTAQPERSRDTQACAPSGVAGPSMEALRSSGGAQAAVLPCRQFVGARLGEGHVPLISRGPPSSLSRPVRGSPDSGLRHRMQRRRCRRQAGPGGR